MELQKTKLEILEDKYACNFKLFEGQDILLYFGLRNRPYSMADKPKKIPDKTKALFEEALGKQLFKCERLNPFKRPLKREVYYKILPK